jgi:hypothetical protein
MSERIAAFRLKHRLPAIAGWDGFVPLGGLITCRPSVLARSGNLADKILRGEKTADMPIRQPAKLEPELLACADEVIE